MTTKAPRDTASTRLHALVLGAGAGSRFGGGKLTASWRGGTVLEGALASAFAAPAETVALTVGADPTTAGVARRWAAKAGETARLRVLEIAEWREGMAASLRAGVAALPEDAAGVYVFLGDMPRIPHDVLEPLAEALRGGVAAAVPSFAGKRGHPALIGASLFGAVLRLTGDRGAKSVLDQLGVRLVEVDAPDDGVLFDVDRPGDLT